MTKQIQLVIYLLRKMIQFYVSVSGKSMFALTNWDDPLGTRAECLWNVCTLVKKNINLFLSTEQFQAPPYCAHVFILQFE